MTKRHLFLDLEDTIITPVTEGWFNTHLTNVNKIRAVMEKFQPDFMHVFSFAVWNERELHQFNIDCRPRIERALGMKFSAVPTVDDEIIPACCKVLNLAPSTVDFQEASNFWGKHEAFRLNMRHTFKSGHSPVEVMLLDDAVFNEEFFWPDLQVTGRILNIDELDVTKI